MPPATGDAAGVPHGTYLIRPGLALVLAYAVMVAALAGFVWITLG